MTNPIAAARETSQGDQIKTYHYHWCPGCKTIHGICILPHRQDNGAGWSFTGTLECPTYAPSLLSKGMSNGKPSVCHTFIREGVIEFLSDCTHELAGQKVPLPPLPDWFVKERD